MQYVKIQDGFKTYPYSISQLREDNPRTSFPKVLSDETLAWFGVYPVVPSVNPAYDARVQRIELDSEPEQINGEWVMRWSVFDLTAEEIQAGLDERSKLVRSERDDLLAATDWTANSDVIMSDEMRTYRQALRDVPTQAGFPDNVSWPVKP